LLRWYLNRHVQRMFDGSQAAAPPQVRPLPAPSVPSGALSAVLANVWLDKTEFREGSLSTSSKRCVARGSRPQRFNLASAISA
jgi:hypothetical protein